MSEEKVDAFLNSKDFARLGQIIGQGDKNLAIMILNRLEKMASDAGLGTVFNTNFRGIKQCIMTNNVQQAKDILALLVSKRVKMINDRESDSEYYNE